MKKIFLLSLFIFSITSFSQILDTTFGINGTVFNTFNSAYSKITDIKILSDNKFITCGSTDVGTMAYISLCKFNENGTLDTSFGTDGKIITNFSIPSNYYQYTRDNHFPHLVIQPDNKIIVSGTNRNTSLVPTYDFGMIRYNPNGTLDTTFGANGVVMTDFNNLDDFCNSITLQNDGQIVLVGETNTPIQGVNYGIIRYNSDGSLDLSFGNNGKISLDLSSNFYPYTSSSATSVKIQSTGKIIIGGSCDKQDIGNYTVQFAIVRLNSNGTLDTSFGINGQVFSLSTIGGIKQLTCLLIDNSDKIMAGGFDRIGSINTRKALIQKYDENGNLDSSFANNGSFITDEEKAIYEFSLQNDNKILAVGFTSNPTGYHDYGYLIYRFNSDGTIDNSFGSNGMFTRNPNTGVYVEDQAFAVAYQNNSSKIIIGGTSYSLNVLERYGNVVLSNTNLNSMSPFNLYPNPANDVLKIQNDTNYKIETFTIINVLGKKVLQINDFDSEVNIQDLQKGFYIVEINSENKKFRLKFLKE